ncbi:MAG: AAA family ATPase, partial [Mariniphaga sp.]|nr:AAA family ATPase [Mariniphaga sp.]
MIKNHVKALLEQNMPFVPTACQSELMAGLAHFIASGEPDKIMLIKGFAGTGKTTMIDVMVKTLTVLKIRVVLLAPTGRAAKVMSGYTGMPAFTVHKKIYRQQTSSDGTGRFVIDKNLFADTWFVIDEVSMISNESSQNSIFGSGRLLDDILEYVYSGKNCHLILVGDTAQLPPVGLPVSPALEAHNLKS